MRKLIIRAALAAIAICLSLGSAHAQTSSGITISDPHGYTRKSTRWVNKRVERKRRNKGEMVAEAFAQNMTDLAMFPAVVDTETQDVMAEFAVCHDLSRIRLSQVSVRIESEPFAVEGYPPNVLASGVANLDGRIKIVFWNLRSDIGPQLARALYRGELRNYLWWKLHGAAREMWGVANVCQ